MRRYDSFNCMMMEMYMCGMCKLMHAQNGNSPCSHSV